MDTFVNAGHIQNGKLPYGWRASLLSPFGKVISREEWNSEAWTEADLDFEQQSPERQRAIKSDFETFFEEFGPFFSSWTCVSHIHLWTTAAISNP